MKTSNFPSADPLDGTELIGVVQDETTVQTTTGAVSEIVSGYSFVKVGYGSSLYGFSSVAIGHETLAVGSTSSMAIGNDAVASGQLTLALGSPSYVTGQNSAGVGAYSYNASGNRVTLLGTKNRGSAVYATLIGNANHASQTYQVAIGRNLQNTDAKNSVFIGYGTYAIEPYHAVGIGTEIGVAGPYGVAIGNNCKTNFHGVTIGYHSGFQNVPFYGAGEASIAIGANIYTPVGPAICIGYDGLSVYRATALGDGTLASTETVVIGYGLNAMDTRAVAIGQTIYAVAGSVALGSTHCSTNQAYSMVLGSTSDPAIGGTFVNAGVFTNAMLSPLVMHQKLIGSTTSESETAVLTADGNSPSSGNMPATHNNSLATVTGTVVGVTTGLFDSSGDAANFTLAPVMVLQKDDTYSFIGTPTFTMTSNTEGASEWGVPVLATTEDSTVLTLGVSNSSDVDWMAHLIFEAGKNNAP